LKGTDSDNQHSLRSALLRLLNLQTRHMSLKDCNNEAHHAPKDAFLESVPERKYAHACVHSLISTRACRNCLITRLKSMVQTIMDSWPHVVSPRCVLLRNIASTPIQLLAEPLASRGTRCGSLQRNDSPDLRWRCLWCARAKSAGR
jgi:hypothetical protein